MAYYTPDIKYKEGKRIIEKVINELPDSDSKDAVAHYLKIEQVSLQFYKDKVDEYHSFFSIMKSFLNKAY